MKLTPVQARKLGHLIAHGHALFPGSLYITKICLRERGLIEWEYSNGRGRYLVTAAGHQAHAAYTYRKSRRTYPDAAAAFDDFERTNGRDAQVGDDTTPRSAWRLFLAGWQRSTR